MFSNILKQLRRKKGLTQEQLAAIIGLERSSIGKYESLKKPVTPSNDVLVRIANYFDVSVDYLLENDKQKKSDPLGRESAIESDLNVSTLKKINLSLDKLNRDDLLRVLGYAESLSNQDESKKK